ncbi:hypothetical protein [Pseudolactococcus reticulitermitis]|uniref:Uncharacterized protein n=1 Tax=Pseudolactococcus reticulitermitis TaxID=2025039 RepID=A0A224WWV9_9LACT|nr:hypothetical protein [Lactococcus reticulitermitis]GAX46788.1 hypothetical protein RsY01_368 [Lactococcus reticulitermitis]
MTDQEYTGAPYAEKGEELTISISGSFIFTCPIDFKDFEDLRDYIISNRQDDIDNNLELSED